MITGVDAEAKEKIHMEEVSRLGDSHGRERQMMMKDQVQRLGGRKRLKDENTKFKDHTKKLSDNIMILAEELVTFNNELKNCSPSVQRSMYDQMLPETRWPACYQQAEASRYSRHNLAEFSAEIQTALNSQKPIDYNFKNQ